MYKYMAEMRLTTALTSIFTSKETTMPSGPKRRRAQKKKKEAAAEREKTGNEAKPAAISEGYLYIFTLICFFKY